MTTPLDEKGRWFDLSGDARLGSCATEGCGGQPTKRLEADGVGANYCSGCAANITALSTTPALDGLEADWFIDGKSGCAYGDHIKDAAGLIPVVTLSQAQSALAAVREERVQLSAENEAMAKDAQNAWVKHGGTEIALGQWKARAETAEAEVKRLTEANEAHETAVSFVRRWAVEKEGNGTSAAERLSAIAHHPGIATLNSREKVE